MTTPANAPKQPENKPITEQEQPLTEAPTSIPQLNLQRRLRTNQILQLQSMIGNQAVMRMLALDHQDVIQLERIRDLETGSHYQVIGNIPGTNLKIVCEDLHFWQLEKKRTVDRKIYDPNAQILLTYMNMSSSEVDDLIIVFGKLVAQGVLELSKMIYSLDKATAMGIPVAMSIARLSLIHKTIKEVVKNRLRADHPTLNTTLLTGVDANFEATFDHLEIPGSDPHKFGQVVVFAYYKPLVPGPLRKIVYKPSDLSLDKFLFSTDPVSIASQLGVSMANYQMESQISDDSRHQFEHYGYMEFVNSERPSNGAQVQNVYESLGDILAVAYVYGLRDIHSENYLLRRDKILLIDMEAATGTFTGFHKMELNNLPNHLAKQIGEGFKDLSEPALRRIIPSTPLLKARLRIGFQNKLAALGAGASGAAAFSTLESRFVPFATNELQTLGSLFIGKLGKGADILSQYDRITGTLATETAKKSGPGLVEDFKSLLTHRSTKEAFNRGDVPYWTRRNGNNIHGEDGSLIIANFTHSKLDSVANIQNGIDGRQNPLHARLALNALDTQFINTLLGDPHNEIIAAHAAAKT